MAKPDINTRLLVEGVVGLGMSMGWCPEQTGRILKLLELDTSLGNREGASISWGLAGKGNHSLLMEVAGALEKNPSKPKRDLIFSS